jgi:hypothetical protein
MIRKTILIFFALAIFTHHIYGQDSLAYTSKWQARFLFGTNIPITKLFQGSITDYLLQYDEKSNYWQILSLSYFFSKHWGLEFNYQGATSSRIRKRGDKFSASLQSEYSDKYYVNPNTLFDVGGNASSGWDITQAYLGLIYRFETNKFYVYPKFSIGLTSFQTDWGGATLKEKNSNIEYMVSYSSSSIDSSNEPSSTSFTLAPSVSFGYKITKRFYFNADVLLSYFRTNFVYTKEFTNLYTQETTSKYFDYKKNIFTLSLGAGLIWVIAAHDTRAKHSYTKK